MLIATINYLTLSIMFALFYNKIHNYYISMKKFLIFLTLFLISTLLLYKVRLLSTSLSFILSLICFIIFLKIAIKGVKIKSLLCTYILMYSLNLIISYTVITFFEIFKTNLVLLECIINICIFFLFLLCCHTNTINTLKTIVLSASSSMKISVILLMLLCSMNIILMSDIEHYITNDDLFFVIKGISLSSLLVICIAFPVIVLISTANTHLKNLTKNYEQQIEAQALHYSELSRSNLEMRKFRHDLKNIKIGVGKFINEGRYNEALTMLELADTPSSPLLAFDTGNGIVDALLADKQKKADSSNIKIDFSGAVPTDSITATDLCVIFGNTIDNAMEACGKLDDSTDKRIKVECKCNSGFMFVNMSNPVDKPVAIKSNKIKTTKADKSLHGFGLYSLDKVVKKHNGEMKLSCDDNVFNLDLSLCLK